jgi:hypothetical protein
VNIEHSSPKQRVRPARGHGALDPVAQQHGHVVGKGIHGHGRLDDDEGDAARPHRGVLGDVGDGPRADGHDAPRACGGDGLVGLAQGVGIRVELLAVRPDGGDAQVEVRPQVVDHAGLEVGPGALHGRFVDDQQHRPRALHGFDLVDQMGQRIGVDTDATEPDRPPGRGPRGAPIAQARPQPVDVRGVGERRSGRHPNVGSTASNRRR